MNEEFIQFPRSNDDDKNADDNFDQFEEFPHVMDEKEIRPEKPDNQEMPDLDDKPASDEEEITGWIEEFSIEADESALSQENVNIAELPVSDELSQGETSDEEIFSEETSSENSISEEIRFDEILLDEIPAEDVSQDETQESEISENGSLENASSIEEMFAEIPITDEDETSPEVVFSDEAPGPDETPELEETPLEEATPVDVSAITETWLADQMAAGHYRSILIMKENRIWKMEGKLHRADIHEIERAIFDAQRAGNAIDMARYIRLGENREKFLLYASTISGSLILCTINYPQYPLSEIRARMRDASSNFPAKDEQIFLPVGEEFEELDEPDELPAASVSTDDEAPQVMVDDLIRGSADTMKTMDQHGESDGWVFDNQEAHEEFPEPVLPAVSDVEEMKKTQPDLPQEPGTEEIMPASIEEAVQKTVIIPKAGYGRMKISKPAFGRLFQLTEDELSSLAGVSILKPSFSGITKTEPGLTNPEWAGWFRERFSDWKPAYSDVMSFKRAWLKNQKPANKSKNWTRAASKDRNRIENPPPKDEFGLHLEQAALAAEQPPSQEIETWPETELVPDRTAQVPSKDEWFTGVEKMDEEPIMPPETLADESLTETGTQEFQAADQTAANILEDAGLPHPSEHDTTGAEKPEDENLETPQEEFVFLDENSDFLKDLSQGTTLNGIDQNQDATAFFEDYFNRSGEVIEETAADKDTAPTAPAGEATISAEIDLSGQAETAQIEPAVESAAPEAGVLPVLPILQPVQEEKTGLEEPAQPQEPDKSFDVDNDYNKMLIAMREQFAAASDENGVGQDTADVMSEKSITDASDFPSFSEEVESSIVIEATESPAPESAETEEFPSFDEEQHPDAQQTVMDLRKIISNALTGEEESPASAEIDKVEETSAETSVESKSKGTKDIFGDDLFPWEVETEQADALEVTPTPQSWIETDQPGDALVDLLADANLDPVNLGFDQPIYTCILVPELNEYSLTNPIGVKIREWLPRLSRVFGWQFENILVQPTYLQWTVRVPAGTSQGSIVRKIRQQTSLRIYEEFPDLKDLSQSGNFWAKGYLVVAGSNPPPAEFLDDFIQKNRKSSSAGNR